MEKEYLQIVLNENRRQELWYLLKKIKLQNVLNKNGRQELWYLLKKNQASKCTE